MQLLELLRAITSYKCLLRVPKLSAIISGGGGFALGRSLLRGRRRGFGQDRAGTPWGLKTMEPQGLFRYGSIYWRWSREVRTVEISIDFTWRCWDTVDGRNPAPVYRWFIPLFIGFQPSKVDLFPFFSAHEHAPAMLPNRWVHQVAIQNGWLVLIRDQRWGNWY